MSVMTVPMVAVPLTLYTTLKVPDEPAATLGFVQLTGGEVHVQPAGVAVMDPKVVFAGVASVKVAPVAAPVPVLVTTWV